MMKCILFAALLISGQSLAAEVCNPLSSGEKQDVQPTTSLQSFERCAIKEDITSGVCLTIFYNRFPNPSITFYAVDFDRRLARYHESISNIESNKSKRKAKTIKLQQAQLDHLRCLANAVWAHKNQYLAQQRLRNTLAQQEEAQQLAEEQRKYQECLKNNNNKNSCPLTYVITAEDVGEFPDMNKNDLLESSIHDSQYMVLLDGADAKSIEGNRASLKGGAGDLYSYIYRLFRP